MKIQRRDRKKYEMIESQRVEPMRKWHSPRVCLDGSYDYRFKGYYEYWNKLRDEDDWIWHCKAKFRDKKWEWDDSYFEAVSTGEWDDFKEESAFNRAMFSDKPEWLNVLIRALMVFLFFLVWFGGAYLIIESEWLPYANMWGFLYWVAFILVMEISG